jgi:4-amino-4-deoxy-L-arabinose transferase-like glycosyltransferase
MKKTDSADKGKNRLTQTGIDWLRQNGLIVVAYLLATWFTNPWLMGDTVDYADSVLAYDHGRFLQFWEFGHLFWRPLGWLSYRLFNPLTSMIFGADERAKITFTLIAINWVGGLVCLLLFRALITRVCKREWILNLATIALLFSSAFLDYGQTGSAYVPGIALVLLAALILVRDREQGYKFVNALLAGVVLALGVCLWFPFVLLLPAALSVPLFLFGWEKRQLQPLVYTALVSGLLTIIAYAVVVRVLRIDNIQDLSAWVTAASHGMNQMRGVPRMVFGFANSLIDLSGDGALFKRYLKHDPFNPVSVSDVFRFSLWKLTFAYFFLFCVLINLLRSGLGRRIIGLLVVDLVPTVIFALFIFEAGDMSRYIGVLPLIFLAVAYSLCSDRAIPWTKYVIILFIAISVVTNVRAMAASTLNQREQRVEARIKELVPLLKPNSRVITSHLQDDINNFTRDFLFNPINQNGNLRYYAVAAVNSTQIEHWRGDFASVAYEVWDHDGDLWISKRLLATRPRPEWSWVEGDDPRISWTDLYKFFSQFQMGQSVGGEDGFVLLLPSQQNKEILNQAAQDAKQ